MLHLSPNKGELIDIVVNNSCHIWNTKTGQYKKASNVIHANHVLFILHMRKSGWVLRRRK